MKKILVSTLLVLLATASYVSARNVYDSTGRHIIYDDTIRGQKRVQQQKVDEKKKMQAAAAAKIDYEKALKALEEEENQTTKTSK